MKALRLILILLICLLPLSLAAAQAIPDLRPDNIILYTDYCQAGWGDSVQIGCIDSQGQVFTLEGHNAVLKWPYSLNEQIQYLENRDDLIHLGTLSRDDLMSIKSLIAAVEDQDTASHPAACDAGTETTYAVRSNNGVHEFILLGMSGDDAFENTDPNAQTLYWVARMLFRNVQSYYHTSGMGPAGFTPVSLLSYFGVTEADVRSASIHAYDADCEEGLLEHVLTPDEESSIRDLMLSGTIIRKDNALSVTGGFTVYRFDAADGSLLCTLDLYDDLLLTPDGMYMLGKE